MTELQKRTLTALGLLPWVFIVLFVLPPGFFALAITVLSTAMMIEWLNLQTVPLSKLNRIMLLSLLALFTFILSTGLLGHGVWVMTVLSLLGFATWLVYRYQRHHHFPLAHWPWVTVLTGVILTITFGVSVVQIRETFGKEWLLFGILIVWVMDTGAYFVGRRLGKTKLASHISPGKSWEGVYGGLALTTVLVLIYQQWLPSMSLFFLLYFTLIIAMSSVLGDLFESVFKRHSGKKDSGNLLPGHGGLLDRLDGMLFALPTLWMILLWGLPH